MTLRPLLPRGECQARLQLVFPRTTFDPVLANPLAGAAVAAMIYIDAIIEDTVPFVDSNVCARPTTCLWMSDAAFRCADQLQRIAWRKAALGGKKAVANLLRSWGLSHDAWYGDNSRETLRDETFAEWLRYGAVRANPSVTTTSGRPRWALTASFADLFNPALQGEDLAAAVEGWQAGHLQPGDLVRIRAAGDRERRAHSVPVRLPTGEVRNLAPGDASLIIKAVVEQWMRARLADPVVLTISEPGEKLYVADQATLASLGLAIDTSTLLPDALLVDIGPRPAEFWIVEAVATDGPIDDGRKKELLDWATDQKIPETSCRFLTAFLSRNHHAARRRLKDLATGTFAFYADEPARELSWYELESPIGPSW
ncbi:MAG TPA: BsuBI/PstI family type II restriction endonuclease [Micromonosporaceae bacterium]|nr:BsuBI/PstI family type II restriction endonuclease [Micromonosporaceae bacterium]